MKKIIAFVAALLVSTTAFAQTITVSAAISLKESLTAVAKQYQDDTGEKVEFNFGASGILMTQIQAGAPVDLFVSAGMPQIDTLKKADLLPGPVTVIAKNALVLIVPKDAKDGPASFADLADAKFKHIALGEPKSVPAGQYAMQTLNALKLTDALKGRLVMGANVRQVLDYVVRGEVDVGLVYATDAKEAGAAVRVIAIADEKTHDPILYPAAVLKDAKHPQDAGKFLTYLAGEKGQKILAEKGFLPAK